MSPSRGGVEKGKWKSLVWDGGQREGGLKFIRAVLPILIAEFDFWKCTTILLQRKAQYIPS